MPESGPAPADRTPGESGAGGRQVHGGSEGNGRELSRRRAARRTPPETGRRHHIGAAPNRLQVLHPDGTVRWTRTSPIQLADKSVRALQELAATLSKEMSDAASALDFEEAAALRDEVQAVRAEVRRRDARE